VNIDAAREGKNDHSKIESPYPVLLGKSGWAFDKTGATCRDNKRALLVGCAVAILGLRRYKGRAILIQQKKDWAVVPGSYQDQSQRIGCSEEGGNCEEKKKSANS